MEDYEQRLREEAAIAKVKEEHAHQTMLDAGHFGRYAILGAFVGKGCHIAFNNGDVEFVAVERLDRLRW